MSSIGEPHTTPQNSIVINIYMFILHVDVIICWPSTAGFHGTTEFYNFVALKGFVSHLKPLLFGFVVPFTLPPHHDVTQTGSWPRADTSVCLPPRGARPRSPLHTRGPWGSWRGPRGELAWASVQQPQGSAGRLSLPSDTSAVPSPSSQS